jgi:hypothetical protein
VIVLAAIWLWRRTPPLAGALTDVALQTMGIALATAAFVAAAAVSPSAEAPSAAPRRDGAMSGTLVLAVLKVKSSYLQGVEEPAHPGDVPDTIQWWIGSGQVWRITTFALDHDIRVSAIDAVTSDPVEFARKNNRDNYGDIIRSERVLKFQDCTDASAVARVFKAAALPNRLEVEARRLAFWKPDGAEYRALLKPTSAGKVERPEPSK